MSRERTQTPLNRENFFEKQIIGFDNDGVISGSREAAVDAYNKLANTNRTVNEIKKFNALIDWAMEDMGMTEGEASWINDEIWYRRPDILFKAKPRPGAIELTKELSARKRPFYIITSRPKEFVQSTIDWYQKYYNS